MALTYLLMAALTAVLGLNAASEALMTPPVTEGACVMLSPEMFAGLHASSDVQGPDAIAAESVKQSKARRKEILRQAPGAYVTNPFFVTSYWLDDEKVTLGVCGAPTSITLGENMNKLLDARDEAIDYTELHILNAAINSYKAGELDNISSLAHARKLRGWGFIIVVVIIIVLVFPTPLGDGEIPRPNISPEPSPSPLPSPPLPTYPPSK